MLRLWISIGARLDPGDGLRFLVPIPRKAGMHGVASGVPVCVSVSERRVPPRRRP
jgi:hypothetical protein